MRNMERSGLETQHSGPYGSLPFLIFSHDPEKSLTTENSNERNMETAWSQMQEKTSKAFHAESENHREGAARTTFKLTVRT